MPRPTLPLLEAAKDEESVAGLTRRESGRGSVEMGMFIFGGR